MSGDQENAKSSEITAPVLAAVGPEQLGEAIKLAGCAVTPVEQNGVIRLHSASHGVGFQVLWGNRLAAGQYADFTFSCPLRIQGGSLPHGLLQEWHRSRRFARVSQHGEFIALEMDVFVAGGVTLDYLTVQAQLWTQMMGQFFIYLRNYKADAEAASTGGGEGATPAVEEEAASAA